MGSYVDKMQKSAEGVLRPGEQLIGAIRTMPRGSTVGMGVGGVVGAVVAERQANKANAGNNEGTLAANWPKGRFAVGLTDQRILAFNYTAMGKPKEMVGEFPLEQVASVEQTSKKLTTGVRFAFSDSSSVEVECAKLEKVGDFLSAFERVKKT